MSPDRGDSIGGEEKTDARTRLLIVSLSIAESSYLKSCSAKPVCDTRPVVSN